MLEANVYPVVHLLLFQTLIRHLIYSNTLWLQMQSDLNEMQK